MRIKRTFMYIHFKTHECWVPHNYSEVLPALLVLLVSYARMIVFDNLEDEWFKFCTMVYKTVFKFHFLFCLFMIFLHLFGLPLDHPFHLNVIYVYPKEAVYIFNPYIAWGQATVHAWGSLTSALYVHLSRVILPRF